MKRAAVSSDNSRLLGVVVAVVVVATLYLARIVFIPLALALLFSFLLTPPVAFLERLKIPRIVSIFLVVAILVAALGLIGWKTSEQLVNLTNDLPGYKKTLQEKIHAVRGSSSQSFNKATDTVKELEKEINTAPFPPTAEEAKRPTVALGASDSRPLAVQVVTPRNPVESAERMLGPLATVGAIIVFTVFILVGREDLRNRLIRLAGGTRLNAMTQALDDATQRINRYLFLQLLVNSGYGLVIGIGLHFIGLPNAALWGACAAILRFLPYVGPALAGLLPIIVALAVFPEWHHALATAGLFVVLETIVSNVVEPLLYGRHLGLSPLAVLVAAVFWTLIWGFPGLVLSTPLTVCLVVMGRYVPGLSFFNVLFGDQPVLSPQAQYYQRLLAGDVNEAKQILEQYQKEKSLEELYSAVVIPALALAEQDRHRNELDDETQTFIYQSTREIIDELGADPLQDDAEAKVGRYSQLPRLRKEASERLEVVCIPARDDADEVVAMLLSQLLARLGHNSQSIPLASSAEILRRVGELNPRVVCISALPPFAVGHARALYASLKAHPSDFEVVVCLWQFDGDPLKTAALLKLTNGDGFFTTLPETLQHVDSLSSSLAGIQK